MIFQIQDQKLKQQNQTGFYQNYKLSCFKQNYKNVKKNHQQKGREYLQIIHLIRDLMLVYRIYEEPLQLDNVNIFVVQLLSHAQLFVTSWTAAHQASLSFTVSWNVLKLMSIVLKMPSNHLILCHPIS